jgi:hypothetical protein
LEPRLSYISLVRRLLLHYLLALLARFFGSPTSSFAHAYPNCHWVACISAYCIFDADGCSEIRTFER